MRISDWSSDVCSSDLYDRARLARLLAVADAGATGASARDIAFELVFPHSSPLGGNDWKDSSEQRQTRRLIAQAARMIDDGFWRQIGRASCWERVCPSV